MIWMDASEIVAPDALQSLIPYRSNPTIFLATKLMKNIQRIKTKKNKVDCEEKELGTIESTSTI